MALRSQQNLILEAYDESRIQNHWRHVFVEVVVFPAPQCSTTISMVSATPSGGGRNTWSFSGVFPSISSWKQGGGCQ